VHRRFLLASAGLLNNKQATTHWARAKEFKELFPLVDLKDQKIVIDNGGIYCSGGAMAYINLIIYLVEKYCGKDTAVMTSKTLLIDFENNLTSIPMQCLSLKWLIQTSK